MGLLCGIATSIALFALNQPGVYESFGWEPLFRISDPFLYFSIWAFAVTAVILFVGSLLSAPPPDEKVKYVFGFESQIEDAALSDEQGESP